MGGELLEENDKKTEQKGELDRFSKLMFRRSRQSDFFDKEEDESQDKPEQKYSFHFNNKTNGFDDWFLGKRRKAPEKKTDSKLNQIEETLKNVDFELLMETVDMFMTTAKQYKPLIKEISPFFNRFVKKFKSNDGKQ